MKRFLILTCSISLCFISLGIANATLYDRGGGLIYDDVLDITWLQDANLAATQDFGVTGIAPSGAMNWDTAQDWIDAMSSSNYLGYSDWRLPDAHNQDGSGPDYIYMGYSLTAPDSEMGHMFYNNLGGTLGSNCGDDFVDGATNQTVSIYNLQHNWYWSGTLREGAEDNAWDFDFSFGEQSNEYKDYDSWIWAVRDGDSTSVPVPATILLLGSGLVGLVGFRRKKFKK